MRTRHDDTVGDSSRPLPAGEEANAHGVQGEGTSPHPVAARPPLSPTDRGEDDPIRSCILTRDRASPGSLVRLALAPDGAILPDVRAKAPGRGAWIGVTRAELEMALAKGKLKGALSRAFKGAAFVIPPDLPAKIEAALERNAFDRLGLEARAGTLLTGSERIAAAGRSGQLHALYHAADASADGAGKLAQAWRVGRDAEGSGLKGLTLPVARPILSMALGRENVVHIGVTDGAAADRLAQALGRWLHFIGAELLSLSCETASQGASAPGLPSGQSAVERTEDFE